MRAILPAAALLLLFTAPALAQSAADTPPAGSADGFDADTVTVGVAAAYLSDYEGSNDYRVVPAPAAIGSISGYAFQVLGNRVSVDLIRNQAGPTWDLQAGPIAVLNFNRSNTKSIDDRRVKALGEVNTAYEVGGFVGVGKTGVLTSPYDRLAVSVSYRYDVGNAHESGIWQPTVSYFTPLSQKAAVGIFASGERAAGKYARTYFSVSPQQSLASGLPVYNARGGWKNWSLGVAGTYVLSGDLLHGWKAVGGVNYRRLLNDYADSPLTSIAGSRTQWLGAVGVAYTF
ncbi:MipA/OmpV family protein [Microvirga sp. SRT01]|uniref:MipA/OmpV family protein n=1 Tax=Sphingomonas longa TaxID=2778730 RepID=A0ABS2D7T1_9SPHN|nr:MULTISPECIES: MipA/OmpV family protein [Alphaproteobacteria]MBM6576999.1 MipA/OmpV family protein [Sphingomonas sp. BT552]MBR7710043.1 MipA/OmpV family protein [Microvirga sp. SRT01]